MKRLFVVTAVAFLLFIGCNKSGSQKEQIVIEPELSIAEARQCYSYEVLQEQLKADPSLQQRMDEIEAFTQKYLQNPAAYRIGTDGVTLELPVHVNVLYSNTAEDISDAQIQSQIDVLNQDFAATNSDYNNASPYQAVRSGDIKVRFVWTSANTTRKSSTTTSWGTNDAMKKSSQGGIDPTSPATTLNIWVCNLSNSILGYAQFPGGSLTTDGIVIDNNAFGKGSFSLYSNFNLGRTATHEVGHYFNLRHIWGDRKCGTDYVNDTPAHDGANYGCPAAGHASKCAGKPLEMTMNYMDYTDDPCMYMFSALQATRMQATYAVGGPRATLR